VVFSPSVYRINSIDSTIYLYSYNNKEQLDTITTKISNGSSWVIGYQTCQYNSDGRLYQLNYLTQSLILENYWLIAYNNKGQIDSTTFMIDSVNTFRPYGYVIFAYDNTGNCSESDVIENGIIQEKMKYIGYDNFNSMYSGLPIYNYAQSMP